jgi:hypothetical protein
MNFQEVLHAIVYSCVLAFTSCESHNVFLKNISENVFLYFRKYGHYMVKEIN